MDEENSLANKKYSRKLKNEQYQQQQDNLNDRLQNLQFKFEKMKEFTNQKDIFALCNNFKNNVQENFDLFLSITMISNEAKKLESEIKEIEEEINIYKKYKNSQQEIERNNLISELKTKTEKLKQKKDDYENDTKKFLDQFKHIKNHIQNLFVALKCQEEMTDEEKINFMGGISENNVMGILAQIERKLKFNEKILEHCLEGQEDNIPGGKNENESGISTRQVNDNMKVAFANMDINKIKTMERIKNNQLPDDFKLETLINYSKDIADEVLNNINKNNQNEKKGTSKMPRKNINK